MRRTILLAAVATSFITAAAQINSPAADGYVTRGVGMELTSNYLGSLDQLSYVNQLDPTASDARKAAYYKAMAACNRHESDAIDLLHSYLAAYPTGGERMTVELAIGDCYFNEGRWADALRQYDTLDPVSFDADRAASLGFHRGFCLLKIGEYRQAEQTFASLRGSRAHGNAARFYEGYAAYAQHDYSRAVELFSGVDSSKSPANMADFYLSQIYFSRGDYNRALSTAKQLIRNADASVDREFTAEASRIAGESLYQLGDDAQAIKYLKDYMSQCADPLPSARYILGVSQYRDGAYADAIATLSPVTEQPDAMGQSAYLFIGQAYMKQGNVDAATMALNQAASLSYDKDVAETAFYNYAVARTHGGRVPFGNSVATFEEFLQRYPRSRYANNVQDYIVTGYLADNDYQSALRAINAIPNPSEATLKAKQQVLYTLGTRDLAAGNIAQALTELREARSMSYNPELQRECDLWIGECLYKRGQYDQAATAYLDYLKAAPANAANRPLALYNLGYARFAAKRYGDALTNFNRFVAAPGTTGPAALADAYNRIGDCQYYSSHFAEAAASYDKAYKASPSTGDYALYQSGMMAGMQRKHADKIATMRQVLRQFPQSSLAPSALLQMAEAQGEQGDNRAAIVTYRQLVEQYPSTEQGRQGYLLLAITQMEQGNTNEAITSYRTVIERYPSSEQARMAIDDLKRIYADQGHLDQFAAWLKGVKGAPQMNATEVESLSFAAAEKEYNANGKTAKLEQYVKKFPSGRDVATAYEYLAVSAYESGKNDAALQYATRIVTDFPDSRAAEKALAIKGDIEYKQGKGEKALATYRQLEKKASNASNLEAARLGIMRVSRDLGQHNEVVKMADLLLGTSLGDADKSEVTFARGYAYMSLGKTDKAIADWQPLAERPASLEGSKAAYYLAQLYYDKGDIKQSRRLIEKFIDANPPHHYWLARGFILLSDINRKEGKEFEANEYLKSVRDNYPGSEPDIRQMIDSRLK